MRETKSSSRFRGSVVGVFWFCVLAVAVSAQEPTVSGPKPDLASEFLARVKTITRTASSADRRASLGRMLDKLGVKYEIDEFEIETHSGGNLIVGLGPSRDRQILIGAHLDQFEVGNGALDNAGSCAALLELIEAFKAEPLKNHELKIVFFDLEEVGLFGSKSYAQRVVEGKLRRPDYMINVDIFGYGDAIWMMSEDPDGTLASTFTDVFTKNSMRIRTSAMKRYPPSDHIPFAQAKLPTVSLGLIDEQEIEVVQKLLGGQRVEFPPILKMIHTPEDTVDKINAAQCAAVIPHLETAIRRLDASSVD